MSQTLSQDSTIMITPLMYGQTLQSAQHAIINIVTSSDPNENELMAIQTALSDVLELVKTNQDLPETNKLDCLKELKFIAGLSRHKNDEENETPIQTALLNLASQVSAPEVGEIFNQVQNLAQFFGVEV